ncbi:MAG TPA: hypothetical protein VGM06_20060 [Polyangiaceae bacterium]
MAGKRLRPRAERRQAARSEDRIARGRERLARLDPGGVPERPIDVESASQIEPHAAATACLRCEGANRLKEHAAEIVGGDRLRIVRMECARCGTKRDLWFRIMTPLLS